MSYITRFAPSPTGALHLGHAFSALTAWDMARAHNGHFLLRIEDIDTPRCRPEHEAAIYADLGWLGLHWPKPVMRQSERQQAYSAALAQLSALGLTYPCACTRADMRAALAAPQESLPHMARNSPLYPGTCRHREMKNKQPGDAIRLNMKRALDFLGKTALTFTETGPDHSGIHHITASELANEAGDIVLARRDIATSYHLSVVVDDAAQNISHVLRGLDLFTATKTHVLLQNLLGLPGPEYHHHQLIRDNTGKRLAKRDDARALATLRASGATPANIRALVGI